MMYRPCGVSNLNSPCMEDGKCTKKFLKDFTEQTMECDGYPQYRQRDDGKYVMKNGVPLDNRYIVPYNPYLSKKYSAHINVKICSPCLQVHTNTGLFQGGQHSQIHANAPKG